MMNIRDYLVNSWHNPRAFLPYFLWPFSQLYKLIIYLRKKMIKPKKLNIPIIIVGNITVGGTGKTPLVIWLVKFLQEHNYKPGIVSRGYGGKNKIFPQNVYSDSDTQQMGDEAVLLARRAGCPVIIDPNRVNAVRYLLNHTDCNIVISDDGLQHYALARDIEIAVIDGERRFGNRWCLPAGPLREPISRLETVDFIVTNGGEVGLGEYGMSLIPGEIYNISDPTLKAHLNDFAGQAVHAIAGIGNPDRFFGTLRELGVSIGR
jgi:tetraacyldisaccharide 4'-kinase